jgi:hypothetical protein
MIRRSIDRETPAETRRSDRKKLVTTSAPDLITNTENGVLHVAGS